MRDTAVLIHRNEEGELDHVLPVTFEFTQEDGKWVGVCLETGTSTFADTLEAVRQELGEAVALQLSEAERLGFIWPFLKDHGLT